MEQGDQESAVTKTVLEDIEIMNEADALPIRQDPIIEKLLKKLPKEIADSYTDTQLQGFRIALGDRTWAKHFIDNRGTFSFPFVRLRFFYVFLLGKNKRAYTRREKHASMLMFVGLVLSFIAISILLGLFTLYILKSAMGIDLLEGTSLGVWDWFRDLF
ncbi:hypothetical protein [Shewanella woodyi]|uniref:3-phosphoshikimate 1-carboxyvinyltransferase n=1 Tax=Shewanella woodyi (strain ATCC 51908 / MS32) TaxID=392500 RepID=B1KPQ2_SHEWM|nr:hypothetical protein [Shewanella woodyi]ACA87585.1 conserved hypothetical protein [Shewanella woodyi ATCC 51908]